MSDLTIRKAQVEDCQLIYDFILAAATFEKMEDEVVATPEDLRLSLFEKHQAEVLFGETRGIPVAFALFYTKYSSFLGNASLYLEDLFVEKKYRGKGYGTDMLAALAKIAVERGYERLDWLCHEWNTKAIGFYQQQGAQILGELRVLRLSGDNLKEFSANAKGEKA